MSSFRAPPLGVLGLCGLLTACAAHLPEPALPDPATVFVMPQSQASLPIVLGALEPHFDSRPVLPMMVSYPPSSSRLPPPLPYASPFAQEGKAGIIPRSQKKLSPEALIRQAAQESLIRPTAANYFGGGASTRYTYQPDKIFEVVTAVDSATVIRLPVGEHLMHAVVMDEELWLVGGAHSGNGPTWQESILVQPKKAGLSTRMPLICQSGRAYYVMLRSTETLSMAEVTWQLAPSIAMADGDTAAPGKSESDRRRPAGFGLETPPPPKVGVDRVHTAWKIDATKGKPPWMPASVWDDGSAIIVVFPLSLSYTVAPAAFVLGANGKPTITEVTPWEDGVPGHGAYYVISGLYAVVVLKDGQGNEVRLTRVSLQPPPYREVSRAPVH